MASGHGRRRARRRGAARAPRHARAARPVRARTARDANRVRRRDRQRRVARDGTSGRRPAGRAGARAHLVAGAHPRRRVDPPGRGGPVSMSAAGKRNLVVTLCAGIGGARLALGLSRVVPGDDLVLVGNTGDDFEHLGLMISPDLDTIMYTLAGLNDPQRGWGRRNETWTFMDALAALGGETWFALGDGDLATHVERTRRRAAGEALSAITADFCRRLGVAARLVPMTDDKVRTRSEERRVGKE